MAKNSKKSGIASASMTDRVAELRDGFHRIQVERMQDVPLLNPALSVSTIGFRRWNAYWLGVLITPWMMKLMALPMNKQCLLLDEIAAKFPSGEYILNRDELPEIGDYYTVSLFSPMDDFADQRQAESTGMEIMKNLFEKENSGAVSEDVAKNSKLSKAMTRRELLFGMFRDGRS